MVTPTRHKDVWIYLYGCYSQTLTSDGTTSVVVTGPTPLLPTKTAFHRVYVNGAKVSISSISAKTYTLSSAPTSGDSIEVIYPVSTQTSLRIQQGIDYGSDAKTDEWEELNSTVTNTDLLSRSGSGTIKLLRNDKTEISLLESWAEDASYCLFAIKDNKSALSPKEYVILPGAKILGIKGGISVGGKWEDTISISFKTPIETSTV